MNIAVLIAVWQRRELTEMVYQSMQCHATIAAKRGIQLQLVVVASDKEDTELAKRYAEHVVFAPNDQLGEKLNIGLAKCLELNADYVMGLGSDDFLSLDFWDYVQPYLQNNTPFFGFNAIYFAHPKTARYKYYQYLSIFGAGRFMRTDIARTAAECILVRYRDSTASPTFGGAKGSVQWLPTCRVRDALHEVIDGEVRIKLWNPTRQSGLDFNSETNIVKVHGMEAARPRQVFVKHGATVLDVKTGTNIHHYDTFHGQRLGELEVVHLLERFGLSEFGAWNSLMGGRSTCSMSF